MTASPSQAEGVLPDEVIRDSRSDAELIYLSLKPEVPPDQLEQFLRALTTSVTTLTSGEGAERSASACVGLGRAFFSRVAVSPLGLAEPIDLPEEATGTVLSADIAIYILCREEWRAADFRRDIARIGAGVIEAVASERGFQRPTGRELGGFRDGLRNAQVDRESIVFVDRDRDPDEPDAAEGGSYMSTMRVSQDLPAWEALATEDQEQVIGRRKEDGSRLDLEAGSAIADEGDIGSACPMGSHVVKSGPRGQHRDPVKIFRRGVPYVELGGDGTLDAGLLFVSFQASMTQFLTVLKEWMFNTDFPTNGTGIDVLFARNLAKVLHTGFFFVPRPSEFLGSDFLVQIAHDDRCKGRVAVRKVLTDSNGTPIHAERGGFSFQLLTADGTTPVNDPFATDSTGRAVSPAVPIGEPYILREVGVRPGFDPAPDVTITLDTRHLSVEVVNKTTPANPNPGYGN